MKSRCVLMGEEVEKGTSGPGRSGAATGIILNIMFASHRLANVVFGPRHEWKLEQTA